MLSPQKFVELFEERYNSRLSSLKKKNELMKASIHPYSINKTISHAPIILGSSSTRMSILNLGEIVCEEKFYNKNFLYPIGYTCKRKYRPYQKKNKESVQIETKDEIEDKKTVKDEKIFYWMVITEKGCTIGCDKKEWKSWEEFVKEFERFEKREQSADKITAESLNSQTGKDAESKAKDKFPTYTTNHKLDGMSFEEFFGFTNPQLQKLLEQKMYSKYRDGIPGYVGLAKE